MFSKIAYTKYFTKSLSILFLASALVMTACADDTESSASANCGAPTMDGNLNALDAGCRSAGEEEHVRLDGLDIPDGESLTVHVYSSSDSAATGALSITLTNTGLTVSLDGNSVPATYDTANPSTVCVDLHIEEDPIHILAWTGSDCDASDGLEASAFLDNDSILAIPSAGLAEDGSSVLYQSSSDAVKADEITTDEPIFEEQPE